MSVTRTGLRPGPSPRTIRDEAGAVHPVPAGWELLPPGDAGLTRAVKGMGPTWAVEEKRGRKVFSRGIWAPAEHIERARGAVDAQRADPAYQRKLEAGRQRRADEQAAYVEEFEAEVRAFLRFHERHAAVAAELARRVTAHATPVGSGTVARTERIPVERRAEAAVIAWMRHQTTSYDDMVVVRVKGARREVRRELAERSRMVLQRYRRGEPIAADCPLAAALARPVEPDTSPPPAPARAPAAPVRREPIARSPVNLHFSTGASGSRRGPPGGRVEVASQVEPRASALPTAPPARPAARPPAMPAAPPAPQAQPAARSHLPPVAPPAPPAARPLSTSIRTRAPAAPAPPAAPTAPRDPAQTATALPTPRTPEEEARLAQYLKVRERLTRR